MLHRHDHGHDHGREHDHADHLHGHEAGPEAVRPGGRAWLRFALAGLIAAAAIAASCLILIEPGEAVVVTRFGRPVRVITTPGLALRAPAPVESTIGVDLRLRTTSTGLRDVGTRDGLRILVQAYVAWQVPGDAGRIEQFLRAVRGEPDQAGEQLRSFVASALETTVGRFDLAQLVNTDPTQVRIEALEQRLRERLEAQVLAVYGVGIRQLGIERLTLPNETLAATVARMRAERQTVAAERVAEGQRVAAQIRSDADRDARISVARAQAEAAGIEAKAREEAAGIYGRAYRADPELYRLLRSMDTLETVIGDNTRLILRTDAAPFDVLVERPYGPGPGTDHAPDNPQPSATGPAGRAEAAPAVTGPPR